MGNVFISLASGLLGVIIGAVVQIIYNSRVEKQRLLHDYKKICITEWLLLHHEANKLYENPQPHNSTILRQLINQKIELLTFIGGVHKKYKIEILNLQKKLKDEDEHISLGNFAEEAVNIGKNSENKAKLVREVSTLINIVLKELSTL